jgi:hypothetical protein
MVKNSPQAAMVMGVLVTIFPKATTPGSRCVLATMELVGGGLLPVGWRGRGRRGGGTGGRGPATVTGKQSLSWRTLEQTPGCNAGQ